MLSQKGVTAIGRPSASETNTHQQWEEDRALWSERGVMMIKKGRRMTKK